MSDPTDVEDVKVPEDEPDAPPIDPADLPEVKDADPVDTEAASKN